MATTNITVRVDKEVKREFDIFCENVGINSTAAVNMLIKAVLRNCELPFPVTDITSIKEKKYYGTRAMEAIRNMRAISSQNGNAEMSLKEINAEIEAARIEVSEKSC